MQHECASLLVVPPTPQHTVAPADAWVTALALHCGVDLAPYAAGLHMQHERASLLVAPHREEGAADAKRKPPAARAPAAENAKRGKSAAAAAKPTTAAVHGITAVSSEPSELPAKHPEAADEVRSPARFAN